MHRPSAPRRAVRRLAALSLAVALTGGLTVACVPPAPGGPGGPGTNEHFCEFFEKVVETPPVDNAVLVKPDVVALAEDATVIGEECTDSGARVELDGAMLAEGEEVLAELDSPGSERIAAVTGDAIAPDELVLENLRVKTLSASIGSNGITLRGNVEVRLSGSTSTIGFVGTLSDLDNWSVTLSSTAFSIPGLTTTPAQFSGTLRVSHGVPSLSLSAAVTSAKIGDVTVNGAQVSLTASPHAGVSAAVSGAIKVGPSTANGTVDVTFDRTGTLVAARADIAAHLVGRQAGGKQIDLQGTVSFEGNAEETVATFSGSGIVGDLVVHNASGSLTLAVNKATFVGVLDVAQGANTVRFNGSIVWDGQTAHTPFLSLQGDGEFSGTLQNGQTVAVAGSVDTEVIGGQLRTVVTGDIKVGTLQATGEAIVESNGATTTLFVDADLANAGFGARLEGAVIITDGIAETVHLDAAVDGTVKLGDATLTGATLQIRSTYGNPIQASFSGGLRVGNRANLTGTVAASFGPNGALLSLDGQLQGSLTLDSWGLVNFNGSVVASPEQVTLTGAGGISTINFPLGVDFSGSFTSSRTQPTWSLHGSGRLRIASLDIASARLNLSHTAGMKATRAGFYFSIIGIPTYFEADFYMKPGGGCDKVNITGGSLIARPIAALALPGVVGCPVHI